jgi:spermidine/putrescine transport system substrate-binding protein
MRIKPFLAFLSLVITAAGCSSIGWPATAPQPPAQKPLIFYSWAGYMPQGILDLFQQEYGIPVEYITYADQDEALAQLRAGKRQFDVAVLGDVHLAAAVTEGLLAELDYQNIPNFRNLGANFRDLTNDPENRYSIMIQWGTTGIIARSDQLLQPVTSWADLWNPTYAGRVGIWPYPREVIGITLKSLGYSVNSEDPEELRAAADKLALLRKNVFLLDPSAPTGTASLLDGNNVMFFGWSFDAMEAQERLDSAVYVLPQEGTVLWSDSVTVPANSPHKQAAEQFINFLLRPEIGAQMVNEMWIPSPNEAARPFIKPEILKNPLVYPPPENLGQAEFYAEVSTETQKLQEEMWARFLAQEGPVQDERHVP